MTRAGGILAAVMLVAVLIGSVGAQQVVDAAPDVDEFRESYDPVPKTSGGQLIGLRLVGGAGMVHGSGPVFMQPDETTTRVCIEVHTRDGRYSASNPFRLSSAPAEWVRVATLSSEYRDTLDRYDVADVAVRTFVAGEAACDTREALHLPARGDPAAPTDRFEVLVNSGGLKVRAQLVASGGSAEASGKCGPAGEGARIAFNTVCSFAAGDLPAGEARLTLEFDDGFGSEEVRYRVLLPGSAPQ